MDSKPRDVGALILTRKVVVVGLGYVGLPLVQACMEAGFEVFGVDTDHARIDQLTAGRSYVDDIADQEVGHWIANGLMVSTDVPAVKGSATYVICVPTPLRPGETPDLEYVDAAAAAIADRVESSSQEPSLVILESTTYPGTTEEFVLPHLINAGLQPGIDVLVAYSPERIDPGNTEFTLRNTPKVVGGLTARCLEAAVDFYRNVVTEVVTVSGLREAEMTKLLENTYRHVNIALANEFSIVCRALGISEWEVISAAATKPYGFHPFFPGPGVGGHCIPIDPHYLNHRVKTHLGSEFRLIELAQEINSAMPLVVLQRIQDRLNAQGKPLKGSRVLLLGVTYKANISDTRESPAVPLVQALRDTGAAVAYHDPHVNSWYVDNADVPTISADQLSSELHASDCVVILQPHSQYLEMRDAFDNDRTIDTCGLSKR